MCIRRVDRIRQTGLSLIELLMFIVVVSVGLAGILLVMDVTTRNSADPMIRKQALAIAESLMEEVQLMPFTYCDPDDVQVENATASDAVQCPAAGGGGGPEIMGPEPVAAGSEGRYASPQFDNVNDYHNFTMNAGNGGIRDVNFTQIATLNGYSALITMTAPGLGGIAANETLLIKVTVTGPDNVPITLEGVRTRYAPKSPP